MRFPTRAALLAAGLGLVTGTAAGVGIYHFLLRPDLLVLPVLLVGIALGAATSAVASIVTYLLVRWRLAISAPPMGVWLGACMGFVVLAFVTLGHAIFNPGAAGVLASFLGQFTVAVIVVGWLALLSGAALGYHINRISERSGA
jgi:riboflavin transporter FmnP